MILHMFLSQDDVIGEERPSVEIHFTLREERTHAPPSPVPRPSDDTDELLAPSTERDELAPRALSPAPPERRALSPCPSPPPLSPRLSPSPPRSPVSASPGPRVVQGKEIYFCYLFVQIQR